MMIIKHLHEKTNIYCFVSFFRMKLCYLLPKVKSTLKIPTDKHLLQQLELCIRKLLCQEKDKDVLTIVKRVSIFLFPQHFALGLSLKGDQPYSFC